MVYTSDYTISKVYKNNYLAKYMEVYEQVREKMAKLYTDEQAIQSATATVMIAFSKAAGMDIPGTVTWDEAEAVSDEDFKTFAELKEKPADAPKSGNYNKPYNNGGNYSKPYSGGQGNYQKKPYNGPSELKGPVSEAQINKINEYLNDPNPAVSDEAVRMLKELDVSDPEKLSKQEASDIIGACIAKKKAGGYGGRKF